MTVGTKQVHPAPWKAEAYGFAGADVSLPVSAHDDLVAPIGVGVELAFPAECFFHPHRNVDHTGTGRG